MKQTRGQRNDVNVVDILKLSSLEVTSNCYTLIDFALFFYVVLVAVVKFTKNLGKFLILYFEQYQNYREKCQFETILVAFDKIGQTLTTKTLYITEWQAFLTGSLGKPT